MIISRSAGIEKLEQGLLLVISQFPKSSCCLEKYFVEEQKCLTYHDVQSHIVFHKATEEGSNAAFCQKDAIIDFELYLMSLEHGEHFYQFVTATDWIPVLGFDKKISVLDGEKFVSSFFDMRIKTLLIAKSYKKICLKQL